MSILLLPLVMWVVWLINGLWTIKFVIDPLCDRLLVEKNMWYLRNRNSVSQIFDYHSLFRFDAWFGFKHWFYPFQVPGK